MADLSRAGERGRGVLQLIAYVESLKGPQPGPGTARRRLAAGKPVSAAAALPPPPVERKLPKSHYLNADYGVKSWLLTTDHKRIAILYLASVTLMFFLAAPSLCSSASSS
jgi:hypothetical protein